jgi:membrane protein YdbS with pleckstrin-like domain
VISVGVNAVVGIAAVVALLIWTSPVWAALAALAVLAVTAWEWWLIGRQVAAIGYAERGDDLVVTQGIMFKQLVLVPYGRMQLVDLKAGPVDRRYGMATLQLHTAAATTDAVIPGLPVAEAERLRDRLAALGEARSAGL